MNARTVNKVWTGIFYGVAALVVGFAGFFNVRNSAKGMGILGS